MNLNKWSEWYDGLPEHTKKYLESQPIWHDRDMWRAGIVGSIIGFLVGVVVGFEWAWRPVVAVIRPLVG
jgi:hypothetical protein